MDPKVRDDFPFLQRDPAPIYFDNACMTLKPRQVIDAINDYYTNMPVCGGRSVHSVGMDVTMRVEESREAFRAFFGAKGREVIFTKNTTEAINMVAKGYQFERGERVILSGQEHNSNLVPWLQVARAKGIEVVAVPPTPEMTFDLEAFADELRKGAAMVALTHTSNLNGYTAPLAEVVGMAHERGARVLVDGAQSAPHSRLDLDRLDVDFFALSVHKMLGPTGLGALIASSEALDGIEPLIAGGGTIIRTTYDDFTFAGVPEKFEGGLQHFAGIIGAKPALDYLSRIGMDEVEAHERRLNARLTQGLVEMGGVTIVPPLDPMLRSGITSFLVDGMNPHDIAMMLDQVGHIMVRSGRHCVDSWFEAARDGPWLPGHDISGTCRASLYIYNTEEEVDIFLENMRGVTNFMGGGPIA